MVRRSFLHPATALCSGRPVLISTGVYSFPRDKAARIALGELKDSDLDITIVCYYPWERKEYDELMK